MLIMQGYLMDVWMMDIIKITTTKPLNQNRMETKKQLTAVEWLVKELKKIGFLTNNIVEFENQVQIAKEMEAKQRQEDKLNGMKEIEKAAEEHADNNSFCEASTDFELQISKRAFISGANWMLDKLQDFDTWKEWKDINL